MSRKEGKVGIEIIIRDHKGDVIATKSMKERYDQDSHVAESCETYQAVPFALEIGIRRIILEGDALKRC